jgi:two-component sensor histidine kinase
MAAPYVRGLLATIERAHARRQVTIEATLDDFQLDVDDALFLGTCLQELLANAYRHAFPMMAAGRVRVKLTRTRARTVLTVDDDGRSGALPTREHMGLHIVRTMAEARRGKFDVRRSRSGTRSTVWWPTR